MLGNAQCLVDPPFVNKIGDAFVLIQSSKVGHRHLRLLLAAEARVERDEFEFSRPLAEDRVAREVLVERRDLGQARQEHEDGARPRVVVVAIG